MTTGTTVITGGMVLAHGSRQAAPADLLLRDDLIEAIAPPGSVNSESARRIDAANRLVIPGLINAHTHGHGGLAKGAGDWGSYRLKPTTLGANHYMNAWPVMNNDRAAEPDEAKSDFPLLYRFGKDGRLMLYLLDEDATRAAVKAGTASRASGPR